MKKIEITITAKFGSPLQEALATTALTRMLEAWKMFYEQSHKKNKISVVNSLSDQLGEK